MRFSRQVRLTQAQEFSRIFDKPVRSKVGGLIVLARRNDLGYPRLGLAIAKKNVRAATGRNRIKRLIRESFRQHQSKLCGIDIVVLTRPGVGDRSNPVLFKALEKHWNSLLEELCEAS